MDISVPGTDQVRSFSMANTSSREGLLEFVIKVYPDGLFSQFLDKELKVGDRLELTGPFGVFTLRESDADLVFVGGGAGMAPILSLLRSMAERGINRKATFFYGARKQGDLCFVEELAAIAEKLPNFTYIPALSDVLSEIPDSKTESGISDISPDRGNSAVAIAIQTWSGQTGLITDVVKRLTEKDNLAGAHAYVCGPPPMVEAAIPLLETLGVPEKRIYYDKFTTTGEPQ
jgi:propane monooxygenase reductase subunit